MLDQEMLFYRRYVTIGTSPEGKHGSSVNQFGFIFYLVKHIATWRTEERPEHDGKTNGPSSVSSQFKLKWPFVSALIGGGGRGDTGEAWQGTGATLIHPAVHQFTHRQREYSKYIHGLFWAISARDHILPPQSDKISYISYFHVFSFIFPFWGSSRKGLASGKINKHLKRFHC